MVISGIQQIGIGVDDLHTAWDWYRKFIGIDIKIFEEEAVAELMLPYTGEKPQSRRAALAINLQGGGGFEIWQYTKRKPLAPLKNPLLGDLGIFAAKIKCRDAHKVYAGFNKAGINVLGEVHQCPAGINNFFIKDPFDNIFNIVESSSWFKDEQKLTGGTYGAIVGVTDMEASKKFYANILGYDEVVYEKTTGVFAGLSGVPGGDNKVERALLRHSKERKGSFSPLFGPSEIELVKSVDRKPNKIFEGRYWGDLGFIHLTFDVAGFDELRDLCAKEGHAFTVDSTSAHRESFDMGEAAGHFSYIEDPDGALIEFIETHKVPIVKKLGLYLNLKKRDPEKPLSKWILRAFALNRVKDNS